MTIFRASDSYLNRPGTLIAAVPAVLGFVPEKSLVLVTFERGELGCVMRVDLSADLHRSLGPVATAAAAGAPDAAVAVIVDEDGASCRMCRDDYRDLAADLEQVLAARCIALADTYVVDRVAAGGRWRSVADDFQTGAVEDPASSPMAVAAVLGGRRLYTDRAELQDVIAVVDPHRTSLLRAAMERVGHGGDLRPDPAARDDVEHALAMIRLVRDGSDGSAPTDEDLSRLGWAITDPRVRDTLYALAVGRDADCAETLWALLARTLPAPWRTEALVLLAFSAYARGDGALAGVSLEAALGIDSSHRMAGMLDQALQSGMRPEQIRELARTGYRLANRLGVRLPPRQTPGKRAG